MLQKTKGIVLHTLKYNDTSIIVDMYTELSGRTSFLVPVPRSRKAAVKSVLFQPLSFIEFEADFRPSLFILLPPFLMTRTSLQWHFFWQSFCIVLSVKRLKTVRCSLICSILSFGWTNVAKGLPISIWFF